MARLGAQFRPLEGITVHLQLAQDIQIGSRASRTQYQYTLVDADKAELSEWAPAAEEGATFALPDEGDADHAISPTAADTGW